MLMMDVPAAVAKATGEDLRTILHRGFGVVRERQPAQDPEETEEQCLWLDCPFCGRAVLLSGEGPEGLPEAAECDRCDTVFDYSNDEIYSGDPLAVLEGDADRRPHEQAA